MICAWSFSWRLCVVYVGFELEAVLLPHPVLMGKIGQLFQCPKGAAKYQSIVLKTAVVRVNGGVKLYLGIYYRDSKYKLI